MATWKKVIVSGSNISELNNDSGFIASVGGGIVSASAEGDAQGQVKLNGVNVNINALGSTDSPSFTTASAHLVGNVTGDVVGDVVGDVTGDLTGTASFADNAGRIAGQSITNAEAQQVANINSVTISNTQWGYLGSSNQGVATTDSVTFAGVSADLTGTASLATKAETLNVDTVTTNGNFDIVFHDGSNGIDQAGGGELAFNPSSNELTVGGQINANGGVSGNLTGTASFATRAGIANTVINNSIGSDEIQDEAIDPIHLSSATSTAISGAFASDSASIASDIASLVAGAYDLDFAGDTGGDLVITDGEKLTIAGGTNLSTTGSGNSLTINLDGNIDADLTGTASLADKAENIFVNSTNAATDHKLVFVDAAGDSKQLTTDSTAGDLIYRPSTGTLTADVFSGNLTGNVTGTADSASVLANARSFTTTGDVVLASANFDGSSNFTTTATIQANAVEASMLNSNVFGTTAGTALEGNTAVDNVSVSNLKTALAGGFGSNAVTIGDSDDIVTIGNNLVVSGDLTVSGEYFTANVTNLAVDDRYILLNSGSGAGDSGIVFGGSLGSSNEGMALILDDSDDRLVVHSATFDPDSTAVNATLNGTNHYFVAGAFSGSEADAATAKANKLGNIRVEGDIYIYA